MWCRGAARRARPRCSQRMPCTRSRDVPAWNGIWRSQRRCGSVRAQPVFAVTPRRLVSGDDDCSVRAWLPRRRSRLQTCGTTHRASGGRAAGGRTGRQGRNALAWQRERSSDLCATAASGNSAEGESQDIFFTAPQPGHIRLLKRAKSRVRQRGRPARPNRSRAVKSASPRTASARHASHGCGRRPRARSEVGRGRRVRRRA